MDRALWTPSKIGQGKDGEVEQEGLKYENYVGLKSFWAPFKNFKNDRKLRKQLYEESDKCV